MKRTVISPEKKLQQQQQQQQQQQATPNTTPNEIDGSNPNPKDTPRSKRAVVASLAIDRSGPAHPYSSLALSPKGRYALVAGKGTIQLVTVGPEGLKTLRSVKVAHHFYNTTTSSPSSASAANINQPQYGDVRDAFRLAAETRASAVTAGVANMNLNQQYGNIVVTKVAWSSNFYNKAGSLWNNSQRGAIAGGSGLAVDIGMDESFRSLSNSNAELYEQGKHSKGRRKSLRFQDSKSFEGDDDDRADKIPDETMKEDDSLVAAAGSNGVVVVWSAKRLLFSDSGKAPSPTKAGGRFISKNLASSSSAAFLAKKQRKQQPEGILNQHTRAVNGMAWHPTRSGLLLTASQDGTIKLWERRVLARPSNNLHEENSDKKPQSWFSMVGGVVSGASRPGGRGSPTTDEDDDAIKYTWGCKTTFTPGEQDAVRDIRWNKLVPDIFGAVTSNGNLVVYNMHVSIKALVKIAAHTGDAASLDWHPRWPFVVATGGSSDRLVKIWDLESSLESIVNTTTNHRREVQHYRKEVQQYHHDNSNTYDTTKSESSSFSAYSGDSM